LSKYGFVFFIILYEFSKKILHLQDTWGVSIQFLNNMTTNETNNNQKDGSKKGLFIGFIIILLGINGYQFYLSKQDQQTLVQKEEIIEEKTSENTKLSHEVDSLTIEVNKQIEEAKRLGLDNTELLATRDRLEKEKKALLYDKGYRRKYNETQKLLDELKAKLGASGGELEAAQARADSLFKMNQVLKEDKNALRDTISQMAAKTSTLEQKVKLAAHLHTLEIKTTVINKKSKELDEPVYKAKNIVKLNVKFTYADNKVADIGGRTIYMRIIDPDGATLSDPNGSGSFFSEGQEITYTSKQDHLFDNSQKPIAFLYEKPSGPYKPGKYLVEIYTDNEKSGEGAFLVK
jgi:predicted nuclease with TOPRIM domain